MHNRQPRSARAVGCVGTSYTRWQLDGARGGDALSNRMTTHRKSSSDIDPSELGSEPDNLLEYTYLRAQNWKHRREVRAQDPAVRRTRTSRQLAARHERAAKCGSGKGITVAASVGAGQQTRRRDHHHLLGTELRRCKCYCDYSWYDNSSPAALTLLRLLTIVYASTTRFSHSPRRATTSTATMTPTLRLPPVDQTTTYSLFSQVRAPSEGGSDPDSWLE